ncbi:MAG: GDSL-type esterase/lipase family protein [Bacteroidota bacterium]
MRYFFLVLLFIGGLALAQDKVPFQDEVADIQKKYDTIWDATKETIVFTGSSSVRLWKNLEEEFPEHQIVNSGFGGSQAHNLLYFSEELILRFKPKKVFIYEGDNDISAKKKPREVIEDIQKIIAKIKQQDKSTEVVLIAAKPSIARWRLRHKYKRLNKKFRRLVALDDSLDFANVWDVMLNGRKLKKDIFIEDGLHMNAKGYALWYTVINEYIN